MENGAGLAMDASYTVGAERPSTTIEHTDARYTRAMPAPARTDRVLLLRRYPYGESSLVVHGLAREHGRVHWLAKGAYRPKSAFYAVLDLFDTLELAWSPEPRRELQTLRGGDVLVRRRGVSRSLARYRSGLCVLELASFAAQPELPTPELFDAAEHALERLARGHGSPGRALLGFELRFVRLLGIAPALERCAACGDPAPAVWKPGTSDARVAFSAGAGGRLCARCADEARASGRRVGTLPERVCDLARALAADSDAEPESSPEELVRVRDFVARFIEYHLESRPKSYRTFLAVPNRNRPTG